MQHKRVLPLGGGALPALVAIGSTVHALLVANSEGQAAPEVTEGSDQAIAAATW